MNYEKEIAFWKKQFRILDDWNITFDPEAQYKGQCNHNGCKKIAIIYEWHDDCIPMDYICHEILHIAYRATKLDLPDVDKQEIEEIFVQDLCQIINGDIDSGKKAND